MLKKKFQQVLGVLWSKSEAPRSQVKVIHHPTMVGGEEQAKNQGQEADVNQNLMGSRAFVAPEQPRFCGNLSLVLSSHGPTVCNPGGVCCDSHPAKVRQHLGNQDGSHYVKHHTCMGLLDINQTVPSFFLVSRPCPFHA